MSTDLSQNTFSLYQSVTRSKPFNGQCMSTAVDVEWRFTQAFGDDNSSEDDLITAVEFDPTGNYVTVGDKAGRLCLFEAVSGEQTYRSCVNDYFQHQDAPTTSGPSIPYPRQLHVSKPIHNIDVDDESYQEQYDTKTHQSFEVPGWDETDLEPEQLSTYTKYIHNRINNGLMTKTVGQYPSVSLPDGQQATTSLPKQLSYRFYTEFQSHDVEFDCLKSSEIPASINAIKWVESTPTSQSVLAANDKTIKLWTLCDKTVKVEQQQQPVGTSGAFISSPTQNVTLALRRGIYTHAHSYHINSLAPSSNGQNFLSSDDIRILFWDYEYPKQPFNIVDLRPPQLEEITEVVTSTTMHPNSPNLMCFSTSRGCLKLCDLRNNALCDQNIHVRSFDIDEDPVHKSFFSEIVTSVSDVKFTKSGQYLISRDFLHVYIWDLRNDTRPVAVFNVHDYLRNHLSDLYEFDALFDSFKLDASPDGCQIITGSYHNNFAIHNWTNGSTLNFEAGSRSPRRKNKPNRRKTNTLQPQLQTAPSSNQSQQLNGTTSTQGDDNTSILSGSTQNDTNSLNSLRTGQTQNTSTTNSTTNSTPQTTLPTNPNANAITNGIKTGTRLDRNENVNISLINFNRKAIHSVWHPSLDCIAVAGINKLYIYQAFPPQIDDML